MFQINGGSSLAQASLSSSFSNKYEMKKKCWNNEKVFMKHFRNCSDKQGLRYEPSPFSENDHRVHMDVPFPCQPEDSV